MLYIKVVNKLTIGQRIKKRRQELNLSVDELANRLGKNRATVYRYEKDDIKDMPITVLEPLARVLETTPADLMGWKDESDLAQAELSLQDQQAYAIDTLYSVFGDREVEHFKKYIELIPSYARKVDSYTEKLLSMQRMENEVELAAAHERTDIEVTEEDRLKDDAIMKDDSEWM